MEHRLPLTRDTDILICCPNCVIKCSSEVSLLIEVSYIHTIARELYKVKTNRSLIQRYLIWPQNTCIIFNNAIISSASEVTRWSSRSNEWLYLWTRLWVHTPTLATTHSFYPTLRVHC